MFVALAPMEGVYDLPFRLWMSTVSIPKLCSTPFLRVTDTFPKRAIPRRFAPKNEKLAPYVNYKLRPQLMASWPEDFSRVAEQILSSSYSVELNCGWPSPNVVDSRSGSSFWRPQIAWLRSWKKSLIAWDLSNSASRWEPDLNLIKSSMTFSTAYISSPLNILVPMAVHESKSMMA